MSDIKPIPLDSEVAAILKQILEVNGKIVDALCAAPRWIMAGGEQREAVLRGENESLEDYRLRQRLA